MFKIKKDEPKVEDLRAVVREYGDGRKEYVVEMYKYNYLPYGGSVCEWETIASFYTSEEAIKYTNTQRAINNKKAAGRKLINETVIA